MTSHVLLFMLAAIGIAETVYLIRKRIAKEEPVCIFGGECYKVLESKYNRFFGIHNEVLGLAFYIAISFLTAFLVIGIEPIIFWDISIKILITLGVVMSIILIYLQWRVIKTWCFWCVLSALTVFIMGIIVLATELIL
ncbi:vitamin K epoxide reductase family protein [Patescibacteria group bacterium]|nr:vitamin K epoxide reductase family protein [Patescibacteria group bacterium]